MSILSFWADITCGEACWNAKEEICKCSCGGANHGINKRGGVAERTSKIDGERYKLESVGKHGALLGEAEKLNQSVIFSAYWDTAYKTLSVNRLNEKERGAVARVKYATQAQIEKWKELEPFKGQNRYFSDAALLWVRTDLESLRGKQPIIKPGAAETSKKMKALRWQARDFVWLKAKDKGGLEFYKSSLAHIYIEQVFREYAGEIEGLNKDLY